MKAVRVAKGKRTSAIPPPKILPVKALVRFSFFLSLFLGVAPLSAGILIPHSSFRLPQSNIPPEIVLLKGLENESAFDQALRSYRFHQELLLQSFASLGQYATGKMERESDITVERDGRWSEWITRFPRSTLKAGITARDLEGYGVGRPFPVTSKNRGDYNITYTGRETIDGIETLVFQVSPKFMAEIRQKKQSGKKLEERDVGEEGRAFEGKLWIDEHDAAVLKLKGRHVPELKNRYPEYETVRQPVDDYYFPAYTYSDDTLEFERFNLHLRAEISYSEYKKR